MEGRTRPSFLLPMKLIPLAATLPLLLVACGSGSEVITLNGAGATFPAPLYQNWFQTYAQEGGHRVNYQAVGSGSGVRQYNAGTTDFGASDKALSDDKIKDPVVQIPMTGGAIVPAYNNPFLFGSSLTTLTGKSEGIPFVINFQVSP